MSDLSTTYLGLALRSPLVASAGPLTGRIDTLRRLEDAGAGAVVLPSLFEEEVTADALDESRRYTLAAISPEASGYLPAPPEGSGPGDRYLELVAAAKAALSIPVIASLNGVTAGGWVHHAAEIADAGADAIELNVYTVAASAGDSAAGVERRVVDVVAAVRGRTRVPLAVKLSPFFTALPSVVRAVHEAGTDGVVLFNRFYQPDLDIDDLVVVPSLELSTSAELRLPLRWTAILAGRGHGSLALSTGVHQAPDVVKALLVGADVVMTTSSLLRHGPEHLATLRTGLLAWMAERDYGSVGELRGAMRQHAVPDPDAFERANYRHVLQGFTRQYGA